MDYKISTNNHNIWYDMYVSKIYPNVAKPLTLLHEYF